MGKSLVTETPDELISNAERDIMNVKVLISQKFHPADLMYNVISFHSTKNTSIKLLPKKLPHLAPKNPPIRKRKNLSVKNSKKKRPPSREPALSSHHRVSG